MQMQTSMNQNELTGNFSLVQQKHRQWKCLCLKRKRDYQTKGLELEEEENGRDESDEGEADDNRTEDSL